MNKIALKLKVLVVLGIISLGLFLHPSDITAQVTTNHNQQSNIGNNPFLNEDESENVNNKKDTAKVKIRKPLESYLFNDSIKKASNFMWSANLYTNEIEMGHIDTLLNNLQLDTPYQRVGVGDAYMGQLGGPAIPLNYTLRPQYANFGFAQAYNTYYFTPQNAPHYNVKAPFTQFTYLWSGQKKYYEENFKIRHAQNVSPSTGFNIDYKSRGAKGLYAWQTTRDKNLSIGLSHTGKKYTVHAGYIYNAVNIEENGGVLLDSYITDSINELSDNIPTRLHDAKNKIRNNSYYLVQSYGIPFQKVEDTDFSIAEKSSIFFGHSFEMQRWNRKYTDTKDGTITDYTITDPNGGEDINKTLDFYDHWYINPEQTNDSIAELLIANRFFIQLQPWDRNGVVGTIDAGFGVDYNTFYNFALDDYMTAKNEVNKETSYYVYGGLKGKIKEYVSWSGNIEFHPFGDSEGDISFDGEIALSAYIKNKPITLSANIMHESINAEYWMKNYYSNHFKWSNSFDKENETRIEAKLNIPSINLEVSAFQSLLTNKIYYDENALPAQSSEAVSVTGLYVKKNFVVGGLHLNHKILLQWSTDQKVVPVPLGSAYLSYFYEFDVVKDVLRVQMGLDGHINTKYYAFGYNPSTAQFYNQREKELGNYPMVDVFLNAKWKRMRILVKMQHINQDLFGGNDYFTLLHYPQNGRAFKFGISWGFYD